MVTPTEFMRGLARRVEAQARHDFTALPIARATWLRRHRAETLSLIHLPEPTS